MKVLVTGASGFIGKRLVEELLRRDINVVAMQRNHDSGLAPEVRQIYGDITDPGSLGDAGLGCDRLYHLAAMVTFDHGKKDDLLSVNGQGTRNVLAAARRWGVERTVVVSSACTLGLSNSRTRLLSEADCPEQDIVMANPYLQSKLETESAALAASEKAHTVIVNPTTVYGPGDRSLNSGTLVLKVASSSVLPVPPGGSNVIDVDDVVTGIIAAGENGMSGYRYILGGENLSFTNIFDEIASIVNNRPLFATVPSWMRNPMALVAWIIGRWGANRFMTPQIVSDLFAFKFYDSSRARHELSWAPKYTFRKSIERAWDYYEREGLA